MIHDPDRIRTETLDALRRTLPPGLIAQRIAELPPDAQDRIRREFAPRPVVRRYKFTDRSSKP
ncbi:MAG: hypothetical protein Q8Q59_11125 [Luteolibacter sp.]|jgi:hypothetical protein|nr:hypothetical protein [Luteolibacter sp.]